MVGVFFVCFKFCIPVYVVEVSGEAFMIKIFGVSSVDIMFFWEMVLIVFRNDEKRRNVIRDTNGQISRFHIRVNLVGEDVVDDGVSFRVEFCRKGNDWHEEVCHHVFKEVE